MFKTLLLTLLFAVSCSTMTKQEFLSHLDRYDQKDFTIPGQKIERTKELLNEFAGKCLSYQVTEIGGPFATRVLPTIEQEAEKTVLYLFRSDMGSFGSHTDYYTFMAQVWADPKGKTLGKAYYLDSALGPDTTDVSKRMIAWLKGEKKLCPKP